jgi:hypothetical protein
MRAAPAIPVRAASPIRPPRRAALGIARAVAFSDFITDNREIELALVQKDRDVGTYAEFRFAGLRGSGQRIVQATTIKCGDRNTRVRRSDQAAAIATQAMLGLLIQGKYAPRVGQENLARLSQPNATRIAHNRARTDLILKTF